MLKFADINKAFDLMLPGEPVWLSMEEYKILDSCVSLIRENDSWGTEYYKGRRIVTYYCKSNSSTTEDLILTSRNLQARSDATNTTCKFWDSKEGKAVSITTAARLEAEKKVVTAKKVFDKASDELKEAKTALESAQLAESILLEKFPPPEYPK